MGIFPHYIFFYLEQIPPESRILPHGPPGEVGHDVAVAHDLVVELHDAGVVGLEGREQEQEQTVRRELRPATMVEEESKESYASKKRFNSL